MQSCALPNRPSHQMVCLVDHGLLGRAYYHIVSSAFNNFTFRQYSFLHSPIWHYYSKTIHAVTRVFSYYHLCRSGCRIYPDHPDDRHGYLDHPDDRYGYLDHPNDRYGYPTYPDKPDDRTFQSSQLEGIRESFVLRIDPPEERKHRSLLKTVFIELQ